MPKSVEHPLHEEVGQIVKRAAALHPDCRVLDDSACGGNQRIPLFVTKQKSRKTAYCCVDSLILKGNQVRVILEIEESGFIPTKICGKFLTSALSSYFIHESENAQPIEMAPSVAFIQILATTPLIPGSSKAEQWKNLEKSIQGILPIHRVGSYRLLWQESGRDLGSDLGECIGQALSR